MKKTCSLNIVCIIAILYRESDEEKSDEEKSDDGESDDGENDKKNDDLIELFKNEWRINFTNEYDFIYLWTLPYLETFKLKVYS